jgi:hypothetical protein
MNCLTFGFCICSDLICGTRQSRWLIVRKTFLVLQNLDLTFHLDYIEFWSSIGHELKILGSEVLVKKAGKGMGDLLEDISGYFSARQLICTNSFFYSVRLVC